MLNSRFLFLILIMLTMCRFSGSGKKEQEQQIAEQKSQIELPQPPSHPRILWLKGEEEKIRKVIQSDNPLSAVHQVIIRESDEMIEKPLVEYELNGRRLLEKSREARKRIFYLSYAWRVTGDKKYFQQAEKELLNVSSFPDWNPSHFLDVAEMTMAVAIGYDWLYSQLSQENRQKLQDAIIKKGLEPSLESDKHWWTTESGNWNQVCNAGMTYGALAIYDENPELAQKIIRRSIESVKSAMQVYEPDGAFPEGYAYWGYGTTFNVYLLDGLAKAFKTDFGLLENKGFMKTASYLLNMVGPTGLNFNYSDGESKSMLNPAMFWFAEKLNNGSLLFSEKSIMQNKENLWGRELPATLIWGADLDVKDMSMPKELVWSGQGTNPVAMMRSSWSSDAIYLGLKGGSPDNGHGHMDVGSFVMDALGERWAMDLGGQDYGALESKGIDLWNRKQQSERWNIFRLNNHSHNTLTFNNELQQVSGTAPIIQSTTDRAFLSATVDLTSVYKDRAAKAWRGAAIVDQKFVVIKDEIESTTGSTLTWAMITSAEAKMVNAQTAVLTQNGKKLFLKIIEPADARIEMWSTDPVNDYDEPNPDTRKIGFKTALPPKSKTTLTVLLIPGELDSELAKYPAQLKMWNSRTK